MNRIGVLHTGSLGDTIVALPAMWRIRADHPGATITLVTDSGVKGSSLDPALILGPTGIFNDFVYYKSGNHIPSAIKTLRMFRSKRFDAVYYLIRERTPKQALRDTLFFKLAGISRVFGMKDASLKDRYTTDMIPVESITKRLLRRVSTTQGPIRSDLELSLTERTEAQTKLNLQKHVAPQTARYIAVAMGSKMPAKVWPLERFRDVLASLTQDPNIFPIFLGGSEDRKNAESVLTSLPRGLNLCGETSVRQTTAILALCEVCLCIDSGAMHIAAAEGIPCVALFSARSIPGLWHPFGDQHRVLRYEVACGGCELQVCNEMQMKCMSLITVKDVTEACVDLLAKNSLGLVGTRS